MPRRLDEMLDRAWAAARIRQPRFAGSRSSDDPSDPGLPSRVVSAHRAGGLRVGCGGTQGLARDHQAAHEGPKSSSLALPESRVISRALSGGGVRQDRHTCGALSRQRAVSCAGEAGPGRRSGVGARWCGAGVVAGVVGREPGWLGACPSWAPWRWARWWTGVRSSLERGRAARSGRVPGAYLRHAAGCG